MDAIYGLIGYPLGHSFSKEYFEKRFLREHIKTEFRNFEIQSITKFPEILQKYPQIKGLSVTIPYKQTIIPYLDELEESARQIGAVNSIKVEQRADKPYTVGYNTDCYGFGKSLDSFIPQEINTALILGTGGASKAVAYALKERDITYKFVSRTTSQSILTYKDLSNQVIQICQLIINTTPLGMFPNTETFPEIPYQFLTAQHYLYDLVYNPDLTKFLEKGKVNGAHIKNGYDMLEYQAERSWELWNLTN
ncbi:shikimate dehydrogenase [Balneicella halophila]|uniref:Shikimate dehydrogenase n=1 Tax=Balneicella halophila TaxID=1537566 RepID=A0A7L4UNJ0_BALHA|nr:shikimate dehydrogenase [Balneicella halophila]PVX50035.1 shikimate dehydrogenase [Balneicella halophila]